MAQGKPLRRLSRLGPNQQGSMLVEFALLAPVFLMLLFGVLQIGIQFQNYNAIRSLAGDASRMVMIEYQKSNDLNEEEIRASVIGMGIEAPYLLQPDRIDVNITTPETRIAGTREIIVEIRYQPPNWLDFADVPFLQLSYSRPVFVVAPTGS